MLESWSDEQLAALNLKRDQDRLAITWPGNANIYAMTIGRHLEGAAAERPAMIFDAPDGTTRTLSFGDIDRASTGLAASLRALGYGKGDFVALHTGQHPDTAIAHMAVAKIGATAVTLSQLYGPETLLHALNDCRAGAVITDRAAWAAMKDESLPDLRHVIMRDAGRGEIDLDEAFAFQPADFQPDFGMADDPALLMYTSGSTGKPKGILHAHRVLAAYTPSINLFFDLSTDAPDAVFWSPSDWAWVGGLLDMLFPAWMAGRPVATSLERFSPETAYGFMERHRVTHTFLAPTAIKRLALTPDPRERYDLALRVIGTGGEALAAETLTWAEDRLGVVCNEFYGMTEVNHLIGNCTKLYPRKPGSMGLAYPGHEVLLVDDSGHPVADGQTGEIVTSATSPTRFLGYLSNREREDDMHLGPYLRTFDLAERDEDGYFWYKGRSDDLIKSSGFRIGPAEIEACLMAHPFVAECAVVGKPDPDRGAIVKAFVKLRDGYEESDGLADDLKSHVRDRLAAYKMPREVAFVSGFAMTSSGKIDRKRLRMEHTR